MQALYRDFILPRSFRSGRGPSLRNEKQASLCFKDNSNRRRPLGQGKRGGAGAPYPSIFSALMNADCGISTLPNWRIFFLPAFCLSSSLRLRETSPP